jgi:hypothetical protein
MQGPDGRLLRVRSAALVAAVAALLTSVGCMAARADGAAPAAVHVTVHGLPHLEEIAAVLPR